MLDVVIKGGTVIDGTGAPGAQTDLAIKDGRVVRVGATTEEAARTIDATGKLVTPGFIDIHTHYDAQIHWDATLSPSPLHGITTVIGGNCGFTIAPIAPEHGEYLMKMLARVEGMPLASLETGVPWGSWSSFGEWLDLLEGNVAVNAGFNVGHSALRRIVMGERATGEEATPQDLEAMKRLLADSLDAGGIGFTSSWATTHNDASGNPVPSRYCTDEEMVELARVCSDFDGTSLEFIPAVGRFEDRHIQLMAAMSKAANRPLNWNLIAVSTSPKQQAIREQKLSASDYAASHGGRVLALTVPTAIQSRMSIQSGFVFDALNGWAKPMALPDDEKMALLADPVKRRELNELAQGPSPLRGIAKWHKLTVGEIFSEENKEFEGRSIGEIAEEQGRETFDVLCDIVLNDQLQTGLYPLLQGDDDETWELRRDVWRDERTILGGTDAGAHLDLLATFNATTAMLGKGIRQRNLMPWEEAIKMITDDPAQLYGIKERGRLVEGYHADVVVLDPETVGPKETYARHDLPGDAWRLYGEADGIDHVLVNGVEIVDHGEFTEARPGAVLRSGRDTSGTGIS